VLGAVGDLRARNEEIMHKAFTLSAVIDRHQKVREPWYEFLRVPALSLGIYSLPVGSVDPQFSHPEDEVYYVVSGRALLRVENEDCVADPGAILYVRAHTNHRFHSIQSDLTCLVFFAAAPGSESE
jgi:mannose-6-phosphate isomerase-like protein (cupin superfamily)